MESVKIKECRDSNHNKITNDNKSQKMNAKCRFQIASVICPAMELADLPICQTYSDLVTAAI